MLHDYFQMPLKFISYSKALYIENMMCSSLRQRGSCVGQHYNLRSIFVPPTNELARRELHPVLQRPPGGCYRPPRGQARTRGGRTQGRNFLRPGHKEIAEECLEICLTCSLTGRAVSVVRSKSETTTSKLASTEYLPI